MKRRDFLKNTALSPAGLPSLRSQSPAIRHTSEPGLPDLSPAQWIWYPSGRCLQNTFVFFRREFELPSKPKRATRVDRGRQPLSAGGERPAHPMGTGAVRPALAGGRSRRPDRGARAGPQRHRRHGPVLRPRRRHLAHRQAGLSVLARDRTGGRPQARRSSRTRPGRRTCARAWRPGQYKRWYLRALAGGVRRAALSVRLEHAGVHARPGLAARHGARRLAQQAARLFAATPTTSSSSVRRRPAPNCGRAASRCSREPLVPARTLAESLLDRLGAAAGGVLRVPHAGRLRRPSARPCAAETVAGAVARRTRRHARRGADLRVRRAGRRLAALHHRGARRAPSSNCWSRGTRSRRARRCSTPTSTPGPASSAARARTTSRPSTSRACAGCSCTSTAPRAR